MATTKVFQEVEFKNSIDQVIKPGDSVVIVTSGYNHNIKIAAGTYLGKLGNGVRCIKDVKESYWAYKDSGDDVPWSDFPRYPSATQHGGYHTQAYKDALAKHQADRKAFDELIELKDRIVKRTTTLQLNRIFKIDTPAAELKI